MIKQSKTKATLRIAIIGELKALLGRIKARKAGLDVSSIYLLVNERGLKLSQQPALRWHFQKAKEAAGKVPRPRRAPGQFLAVRSAREGRRRH
ncbi:hypothetical protein KB879_26495 [Cupriavidus sp. KK10]|uniref:hypothetical protein n=1 Tax=Cupriavidus sp. KK10 TaxID=1478019 RepID=UPI001BADDEBE|nr:hypothetical protein [Cupriavidus sp. KK10]QUN27577.1 hypothetical protein KB879_26495 [Cupriavidus sp. KK10]